jgi:hypothetical protein
VDLPGPVLHGVGDQLAGQEQHVVQDRRRQVVAPIAQRAASIRCSLSERRQ